MPQHAPKEMGAAEGSRADGALPVAVLGVCVKAAVEEPETGAGAGGALGSVAFGC